MMNINGMARGYMAKNMKPEPFLKQVTSVIERQLREFDDNASVEIRKMHGKFFVMVHYDEESYALMLTEEFISEHQQKSPYSLDRYVWGQLNVLGLKVEGESGYLEVVLKK